MDNVQLENLFVVTVCVVEYNIQIKEHSTYKINVIDMILYNELLEGALHALTLPTVSDKEIFC